MMYDDYIIKEYMREYYLQKNIGKAKYVINFTDGIKTHKDGSRFYDIKIFKNRATMMEFIKELKKQNYKEIS